MNRTVELLAFISTYLLIYGALQYYVLSRLSSLFGIAQTIAWYVLFCILVISYLAATLLERSYPSPVNRISYMLSATWMGVVFMLFVPTLIFDIVSWALPSILHIPRVSIPLLTLEGPLILLAGTILSVIALTNAVTLQIKRITIPIPRLKQAKRIVHLSDIHVGIINTTRWLKRIVKKTNAQNPDAVLITGDLVDGSGPITPHIFTPLREFNAPAYLSFGNHEFYEGATLCTHALDHTTIKILRNAAATCAGMTIIGVDYAQNKNHLATALPPIMNSLKQQKQKKASRDARDDLGKKDPIILMNHTPEGLEAAAEAGVDLMLSGHTHAGQVWPFNYLVRPFHRYVHGLYSITKGTVHKLHRTWLYVSPGTGTWGPPMRLGSRNEIVVIDLVCA
jgi:uncharacterized protein